MTTNNLTQTNEVIARLLQDLANNTGNAQELRELLKVPSTYDLAAIFNTLRVDPDVQNAFKRLKASQPASNYAHRSRQRWYVNASTVDANTTTQGFGSSTLSNDAFLSSDQEVVFDVTDDREQASAPATSIESGNKKLIIAQDGVYRINTALCMSFYPEGVLTGDFSDRQVEFIHTDMLTTPVKAFLTVTPIAPATAARSHHVMVNGRLSQGDMSGNRKRFFGGSVELRLLAGDRVSLHLQRGSQMGRYKRVVSGVTSYVKEVIGLTKTFAPFIGSNPANDDQNWLEIIRIS